MLRFKAENLYGQAPHDGYREIPLKVLALVAVLISGCATTTSSTAKTDPRLIKLLNEVQEIAERERQCINETVLRSNEQIAQIATTPDAFTEARTETAKNDRDREVSECKTNADRENAELSARERADYAEQARLGHDQATLMMILTASRPP
jgi:hypothetical protein